MGERLGRSRGEKDLVSFATGDERSRAPRTRSSEGATGGVTCGGQRKQIRVEQKIAAAHTNFLSPITHCGSFEPDYILVSPAKYGTRRAERRVSTAWNEHDLISNQLQLRLPASTRLCHSNCAFQCASSRPMGVINGSLSADSEHLRGCCTWKWAIYRAYYSVGVRCGSWAATSGT